MLVGHIRSIAVLMAIDTTKGQEIIRIGMTFGADIPFPLVLPGINREVL